MKIEKIRGSRLIFQGRLSSDGTKVEPMRKGVADMHHDIFDVTALSLTEGTFLAKNMSTFVVRKKSEQSTAYEELQEHLKKWGGTAGAKPIKDKALLHYSTISSEEFVVEENLNRRVSVVRSKRDANGVYMSSFNELTRDDLLNLYRVMYRYFLAEVVSGYSRRTPEP